MALERASLKTSHSREVINITAKHEQQLEMERWVGEGGREGGWWGREGGWWGREGQGGDGKEGREGGRSEVGIGASEGGREWTKRVNEHHSKT